MPAASRPRRFAKMLLLLRPSSAESSSIERAPSARYSAATTWPPRRVIPGKLAATSAPTPSSSVPRASATGSLRGFGARGAVLPPQPAPHPAQSHLPVDAAQDPPLPPPSPRRRPPPRPPPAP